jgi:hypothetical protein
MEQIEVFWKGQLVGERLDGEYKTFCKQVDGFYVEYLILGNIYKDMRAFKNPDLLQPYSDRMPFSFGSP